MMCGVSQITAGLRQRKKERTREAIVDAALALFAERGFESTTVADIAAAADIAPRTFFGYFPAKEDVVFHDFDAVHDALRLRLRDREPGETAIDAMRAWIAGLVAQADFKDERERCRHQIVRDTPALQDRDRALLGRFEGLIAEAVAADLDVAPSSLRARIVGAAATAAMSTLEELYGDGHDELADPMAVVDEALVFLRGGVAALSEKPPPA
jgi:AcrR family transcriptional regulator